MQEKVLNNRKNGMAMLLLFSALYAASIICTVLGAMNGSIVPLIAGIVYICVGWLPFLGLKVLRPQEALVLTLFGNYAGTLREAGFYFVNPFCIGVNPRPRRSSTRAATWTAARPRRCSFSARASIP